MKKIALIGPDFFSYIQSIRDEFISRGYPCVYYDERHANDILTKIYYRLQLTSFIKKKRDLHLAYVLNQILLNGVTDVFFIDIEVVTENFVKSLKDNRINAHLYMWDSALNKDSFLKLLPLMTSKASFEPADCSKYEMKYIPLFAEEFFSQPTDMESKRNNEIVFLGTLHSHRAKHLDMLERLTSLGGVKIKKLLYYHSKWLYTIKCFLNPVAFKYLKYLRTEGFSKFEIASAYFHSLAVLDIHHPGQTGLTSRTFESLRSGAWLITLNRTVLTLPAELQKRVLLLSKMSELSDRIVELHPNLPPLSAEMDYFLSLARFSDELLANAGLSQNSSR